MSDVNQLIIKPRKYYVDAFSSREVKLYLPIDSMGDVVELGKASRLEMWITDPDQRNAHIPGVLERNPNQLYSALLKKDNDEEFSYLRSSVPYGTIKAMNDWLHTLKRHPEGDIYRFIIGEL